MAVQKDGMTAGHVPRTISLPLLSVCSVRWFNSMHNYWCVDYSSWQVLGKEVCSLKGNL